MMTSDATEEKFLWLLIEENFLELSSQDLSGENREVAIQRIAGKLDKRDTAQVTMFRVMGTICFN